MSRHQGSLLFFLIICAFCIDPSFQTGQWTQQDITDSSSGLYENFLKVQQYALSHLKDYGILNQNYQFQSVANVYTQVVAGMNWKFDLIFSKENEHRNVNVVIWQKLPNSEEQFHLRHVSVDFSDTERKFLGGWTEAVNEDFEDIKTVLDFSLKTLKDKAPETKDLKFKQISKIETQITQGKNYKLMLEFENNNNDVLSYQAVVWVKTPTEINFISFDSPKPKKIYETLETFPGGWTDLDPENLGSIDEKALKFAQKNLEEKIELKEFYFDRIENAMSQIVAGIKYKYILVYKRNTEEKKYEVIIWKKLDRFNTLNENYEVTEIKELN